MELNHTKRKINSTKGKIRTANLPCDRQKIKKRKKTQWTQQMMTPTPTSKPFTRITDVSIEIPQNYFNSNSVYFIRPPKSISSRPWIITRQVTRIQYISLLHPLTSKPHSFGFDRNFNFSQLQSSSLAAFYAFEAEYPVDKLLVFPTPPLCQSVNFYSSTMLALYGGGELLGYLRYISWVRLLPYRSEKFDDIVGYQDKIYVVDRQGITKLVEYDRNISKINIGETIVSRPLTPGSGRFGWRKRFVVDGQTMYLVVRTEEKLFDVFRLERGAKGTETGFYWDRVRGFEGKKVLFMARNHYFFLRASSKFPGREYRNCIVFSEAAFPQYGNDCWEFTQSGDRQFSEDDIAVFRLDDQRFAREGEGDNSEFPKIDWSPPDWILNVSSFPADEFKNPSGSESPSSQSESEPDEEGLDQDSGNKNDGEVLSDLKDTKSEDKVKRQEMKSDFGSQDQDQRRVESYPDSQDKGGVESNSDSQDQEDEKMQSDSNSQQNKDEKMHSEGANIEGAASLPKDPVTPSRSAVEEEVTRTLLRMNSGNDAVTEETPGKNKASTSSRTVSHIRDTATTKFEGLDIRSNLVPILQKIWQKHGNIIKDSIVRSGDIVARALESLATMVRILEDNPAQSLSDSQADYLTSTMSDLRNICFKVYWLVSFVEKAVKVHKSKPLVESLNNLSQLSSQVKERRAFLLGELAKLNEEENKLKEEMVKVSKTIPFSGQVKFDAPIGAGLT